MFHNFLFSFVSYCIISIIPGLVHGHSSYMLSSYCSTPITVGTYIMGYSASSSSSYSVSVKRGAVALSSGSSYIPGETLSISFSSSPSEYVIQVSNAVFTSGTTGCSNTRVITSGNVQMPSAGSGNVVLWAGWANGQSTVHISPNFILVEATSSKPSVAPTTRYPSSILSIKPSVVPSRSPTVSPTVYIPGTPTLTPTISLHPSSLLSILPSSSPTTSFPSQNPTIYPSFEPSSLPTIITLSSPTSY